MMLAQKKQIRRKQATRHKPKLTIKVIGNGVTGTVGAEKLNNLFQTEVFKCSPRQWG